jgi:hypothetical protein
MWLFLSYVVLPHYDRGRHRDESLNKAVWRGLSSLQRRDSSRRFR